MLLSFLGTSLFLLLSSARVAIAATVTDSFPVDLSECALVTIPEQKVPEPPESALDPLMVRAQQGDRKAFEELWARLQPAVLNRCFSVLKNWEDAQEIAQDVALVAWQKRRECHSNVLGWVRATAFRKSLNRYNREKHTKISLNKPLTGDDGDSPLDLLTGYELKPEEKLLIEETRAEVRAAVVQLSDKFGIRTVAELFYFEGMTIKDIAEQVNRPIGTVKRQLYQVRKKLAQPLEVHGTSG